jgi:hypothetical protein
VKKKKAIKTDDAALALADVLDKVSMFSEVAQAEAPPAPDVTGMIKLRYNHYLEEMEVTHKEGGSGAVAAADVVELLSLDYAFNGSFVVHLNKMQSKMRAKRLWKNKDDDNIPGVEIGKECVSRERKGVLLLSCRVVSIQARSQPTQTSGREERASAPTSRSFLLRERSATTSSCARFARAPTFRVHFSYARGAPLPLALASLVLLLPN